MNPKRVPARATARLHKGADSFTWYFLLIALTIALVAVPAAAGAMPNVSVQPEKTGPEIVRVGVYVVDFNRFNVAEGTVETNFYINFKSDIPVSINDFEIMNGHATSVDTIVDTPMKRSTGLLRS
jgi:hypothetical protein